MGWKESEEAASHTCFVQPKGKSASGLEDSGQLLASPPGSPMFFNACIEKDRGAWSEASQLPKLTTASRYIREILSLIIYKN